MFHRLIATAALGLLVFGTAACGDDTTRTNDTGTNDTGTNDTGTNDTGDPAPAACLVDDPTCYETGAEPSGG